MKKILMILSIIVVVYFFNLISFYYRMHKYAGDSWRESVKTYHENTGNIKCTYQNVFVNSKNFNDKDKKTLFNSCDTMSKTNDPFFYYYMCGVYELGIGVQQNFEKALYWCEKSVTSKITVPFTPPELCAFYYEGKGTQKNTQKALEYCKRCAKEKIRYCYDTMNKILSNS